jgi:hypothetical protein
MAPEQARGKAVDKRADIWAFGVVLYELLTGRQLFDGDNITDVIAAVVTREPDWAALPPETPAHVRRLLQRCLQRDAKVRLRDIGEARIALTSPPADEAPPAPAVAPASSRTPWMIAAILGVAALGAGAIAISHFREQPLAAETVRFQIQPPTGWTFSDVSPTNGLALSPNGRQLAFAAGRGGVVSLFVQALDSLEARQIPATEGAGSPFWSPDSGSVGFFVRGKVKRAALSGGPPVTLCETPGVGIGGSWNRDGVIVFGTNISPIYRAAAGGGSCGPLLKLDTVVRETFHARPWFLPDGRRFLYLSRTDDIDKSGLFIGSLDGGAPKRLLSPTEETGRGYVLFLRDGALLGQPLDARTYEPAGEPFLIADKVGSAISASFYTATPSTLAYRSGGFAGENRMVWFDREGKQLGPLGSGGLGREFEVSRDGRRVAMSRVDPNGGNMDIWTLDTVRGVPMRLTFDPGPDRYPVWSPDGKRIVFASRRETYFELYIKDAAGLAPEQLLLRSEAGKIPWDWSEDGKDLLFGVTPADRQAELWSMALDGSGKAQPYLASVFDLRHAKFSPGTSGTRWVAYDSNESGRVEVYVQSFPAGRGEFQISAGGGALPHWPATARNCTTSRRTENSWRSTFI